MSLSQVKLGDPSREISPLGKWRGPLVSQVMPAVTQSAAGGGVEGGWWRWWWGKGGDTKVNNKKRMSCFQKCSFRTNMLLCFSSLLLPKPGSGSLLVVTRFNIINMCLVFCCCLFCCFYCVYRRSPNCKHQTRSTISGRFGAGIRQGELKCFWSALSPRPLRERGKDLDHLLKRQTHDWTISCGGTSVCGRP